MEIDNLEKIGRVNLFQKIDQHLQVNNSSIVSKLRDEEKPKLSSGNWFLVNEQTRIGVKNLKTKNYFGLATYAPGGFYALPVAKANELKDKMVQKCQTSIKLASKDPDPNYIRVLETIVDDILSLTGTEVDNVWLFKTDFILDLQVLVYI